MTDEFSMFQPESVHSEEELRRLIGDELASNPEAWIQQADLLMRSSEICWFTYERAATQFKACKDQFFERRRPDEAQFIDLSLSETSNFLLALALENCLKGLILWADNTAAQDKDSGFYTHNLVALAEKTGLYAGEEWLQYYLRQLTEAILWQGRYPLPIWTSEKRRADWNLYPTSGFCDLELEHHERFPGHICPSKRKELVSVYRHFRPE